MLHATERVDGKVLWANLFLLFWLSLVPFVIRWMDRNRFHGLTDRGLWRGAGHGRNRLHLLQWAIVACNGQSSTLTAASGSDLKGKLSLSMYVVAIPLAFVSPWIAVVL